MGPDLIFFIVVLTVINANHLDLGSDLLKVSWTELRGNVASALIRSEKQRIRHAQDPEFHEIALRNLERGRIRAWSEAQMLEAIRNFRDRVGRPPSYDELRPANGLPDYKTIWRKFGSSRVAIDKAVGNGHELG